MPFFWRIFLSTWVILIGSTVFTVVVSHLLPNSGSDAQSEAIAERMVTLVARDLAQYLERDAKTGAERIAAEHVLDFSPFLNIYVLDPAGRDVLGRVVPPAVAQAAREAPARALESGRLHIRNVGPENYQVVGYLGFFPMMAVASRPGARSILVVTALLVSVASSLMLARFIVGPVRRLQTAGKQVAAGDLSVRVAPTVGSRTDDIARLAYEFDVMTERVDALLKAQQRLMRDVSHELRSPLARLHALLSIARQRDTNPSSDLIDRMEKELEHLDDLIGEILAFNRLEVREGISRHPTDVIDLVQNIVEDADLEAQTMGKSVCLHGAPRWVIALDSGLIQSAVENVVRNAVRHTAPGTSVDVYVTADADSTRIVVDDNGPGVPDAALVKIFQPFYRVDDARSTQTGSGGIGLAIAERSIRLHGGVIIARNRERGGLRVEFVLPNAPGRAGP